MDNPAEYIQRLEQALENKRALIRELWTYLESLRPIPDVAVHGSRSEGADKTPPQTRSTPTDY